MRIKHLTPGPLGDFCLWIKSEFWKLDDFFLGAYQSTKILLCVKCPCHFPRVTRYVKMFLF